MTSTKVEHVRYLTAEDWDEVQRTHSDAPFSLVGRRVHILWRTPQPRSIYSASSPKAAKPNALSSWGVVVHEEPCQDYVDSNLTVPSSMGTVTKITIRVFNPLLSLEESSSSTSTEGEKPPDSGTEKLLSDVNHIVFGLNKSREGPSEICENSQFCAFRNDTYQFARHLEAGNDKLHHSSNTDVPKLSLKEGFESSFYGMSFTSLAHDKSSEKFRQWILKQSNDSLKRYHPSVQNFFSFLRRDQKYICSVGIQSQYDRKTDGVKWEKSTLSSGLVVSEEYGERVDRVLYSIYASGRFSNDSSKLTDLVEPDNDKFAISMSGVLNMISLLCNRHRRFGHGLGLPLHDHSSLLEIILESVIPALILDTKLSKPEKTSDIAHALGSLLTTLCNKVKSTAKTNPRTYDYTGSDRVYVLLESMLLEATKTMFSVSKNHQTKDIETEAREKFKKYYFMCVSCSRGCSKCKTLVHGLVLEKTYFKRIQIHQQSF